MNNFVELRDCINYDKFRIRMIDDELALFPRTCRIDPDADSPSGDRSHIDDRPFGNIPGEDRNARTLGKSFCEKRACKVMNLVLEVGPSLRDPISGRALEKDRSVFVL